MLFAQPLPKRTGIMRVMLHGVGTELDAAVSYKVTLPLAMIFVERKTDTFFAYWQDSRSVREGAYSHSLMLDLIKLYDEAKPSPHAPWRIHSSFTSRTQELLIRRVAATMGA